MTPKLLTVGLILLYCLSTQAAPLPSLSISSLSLTNQPLKGESISFKLAFDNTDLSDTGFFPYFRFVIPQEMSVSGATCGALGAGTVTQVSTSPAIDIYNLESINLTTGQKLILVLPPIGQLTPTQPNIECSVTASMTGFAALNVPFEITQARAIFAVGSIPNGNFENCSVGGATNTICSPAFSFSFTPRLIRLKTRAIEPAPFVTGPQHTFSLETKGELAAGESLTNVSITDILPDSMVLDSPGFNCSNFTITPTPTSCTFTADPTSLSGGSLNIQFSSLSTSFTATYTGYLRGTYDNGQPVLSPTSGASITRNNDVTLSSTQTGSIKPVSPAVINHRSTHTTKSVAISTDTGVSGYSPGDTIEWTVQVGVSDYFSFKETSLEDQIQDGQTYVPGSFSLKVRENNQDEDFLEADLAPTYLFISGEVAGVTTLNLFLANAMTALRSNPVLNGADSFPSADRGTKYIIKYRTVIDQDYANGAAGSVDVTDPIRNTVSSVDTKIDSEFIPFNWSSSPLPTSETRIISLTTYSKNITHIDAVDTTTLPLPYSVAKDQVVVFRLRAQIPDAGVERLVIEDYLPSPLFEVPGGCIANVATGAPAALAFNSWMLGSGNTAPISPSNVTVACSATSKSIKFSLDGIDLLPGQTNRDVEIYFALRATTKPMTNGLQIVNLASITYGDSFNINNVSLAATASFKVSSPNLTITHHATSSDDTGATVSAGNISGIDAEALVTNTVTLVNDGQGTAQSTILTIPLLSSVYENPNEATTCSGNVACGYDIVLSAGCVGTPSFALSSETEVKVTGIEILQGQTCIVTYKSKVIDSITPNTTATNKATVTWTNGGDPYSPKSAQHNVTSSNVVNTLTGLTASSGAPGDLLDHNNSIRVPEGEMNNAFIDIADSGWLKLTPSASLIKFPSLNSGLIGGITYYCTQPIIASSFVDNICFLNNPELASNQSDDGNRLRINLGKVVNGYRDNSNSNHTFNFDILDGVVEPSATAGAKNIKSTITWNHPVSGTLIAESANVPFTVLRPNVSVETCPTTATTAAQPVSMATSDMRYRVIVKNSGTNLSTAYDVGNISNPLATGTVANGTQTAQYCTTGASTVACASFTTNGSCSTVSVTNVGTATNPQYAIVGQGGGATLPLDGFFMVDFGVAVDCTTLPDLNSASTSGSHSSPPGYNACATSVAAFANTFSNQPSTVAYSSQLGSPAGGEGSYTSAASNIFTLNRDDDGDGIANSVEGSGDVDGDGVPNHRDTDSDDNGISDTVDASVDSDGDGIPAFLDLDDDNDGISDAREIIDAGGATVDWDGDGVPNYRDADSDGDGLAELTEAGYSANRDSQADGANPQDRDSDNDGILDLYEAGLGACDDGSGSGISGNGILEPGEIAACTKTKAPVCKAATCDTNGSGAIDLTELVGDALLDTDGDGIADIYDMDSDNDGLPDLYENLLGAPKFDGGTITLADLALIDTNSSGTIEGATLPTFGSELLALAQLIGNGNGLLSFNELFDSDNDGIPNYLDRDSDSDGIPDIVENGRYTFDEPGVAPGDGNNKVDYGGVGSEYDSTSDYNLVTPIYGSISGGLSMPDRDEDGIWDYLDRDSDNDGLADWIEAWGTNIDTSGNGLISEAEFAGAVGSHGPVPTRNAYYTRSELIDTDSDGTPDIYDLDSDNDDVFDRDEADIRDSSTNTIVDTYANLHRTDGDSLPDFRDTDSDGDSILDSVEAGDSNTSTSPEDFDGDGIPNLRDSDSDADGLTDLSEVSVHNTDPLDADSDNDYLNDGAEVNTHNTNPLDNDTDGGGVLDGLEVIAGSNPRNNPADDVAIAGDTDGDGLSDAQELIVGTNPNDPDSDDDGLFDGAEVNTYLTNPNDSDSDDGGTPDGEEVNLGLNPLDGADDDTDQDGLSTIIERNWGLNPNDRDSNDDCMEDGVEFGTNLSQPKDSDRDGIPDILDKDNDNDGLTDCEEISLGNNPNKGGDARVQGSGRGLGGCSANASTSEAQKESLLFEMLALLGFCGILQVFAKFRKRKTWQ